MDGALLGSIDIALGKAKTSALFGMTSEAVGEFCKSGGPSPGLELTNGTLVVFAGGVPIWDRNRTLIGAVGISGGAVEQDRQVAQAAVWSQAYIELLPADTAVLFSFRDASQRKPSYIRSR